MKTIRKFTVFFLVLTLLFTPCSYVSAEEMPTESEEVVRVGEVESLRETNSETYLMSDGTYECVVYAENKYYLDENEVLQPINNAIVAASGGANLLSTQYTNTANAFDVTFSGSGTPEISISYGDAGITFVPVNATGAGNMHMTASASAVAIGAVQNCATLSQLTATGSNTATYANAFGTADLVYVLENDALKEYIILEDSAAPNSYNFLFTLDGVTLQETDTGAAFLNEAGEAAFYLGGLFAVDANGVPTDDLTYTFQTVKNNIIGVTITLDPEYLAAADRAFPVVIDPTIMISSSSTADACVCSFTPSTNYQMATQLRTGYDTDYGIRRSYIRFSIPDSIEVGGVISAYLDIEKISGVAPTMRAYRVTGSWSSGTITWNNKPGYTTTHQSTQSVPYSSGSSWYRMNVTSIVNGWVDGNYMNYGFVLVDSIENDSDHWTTLYSSDANSPHKPELYINYSGEETTDPEPDPAPEIIRKFVYIRYDNSLPVDYTVVKSEFSVAASGIEEEFGFKFVELSTLLDPQLNGASCPNTQIDKICSSACGDVVHCDQNHHKSTGQLLFMNQSQTYYTCRVVGHMLCYYDTSDAAHSGCYGMATVGGKDTIITTQGNNLQLHIQHELSHNLGASHTTCTPGQQCVLKRTLNTWCDACSAAIRAHIGGL